MTTTTPMVSVRGVHKFFGDLHVLRGIDLDIASGEVDRGGGVPVEVDPRPVRGDAGGQRRVRLGCAGALLQPGFQRGDPA